MIKIANCTKERFRREIANNKIICFCAGQRFREFCAEFEIAENLLYVVDSAKKGTTVTVDGSEIRVVGLEDIGNEVQEAILVISSNEYAEELLKLFDKDSQFDDCMFYCPYLFTVQERQPEIKFGQRQLIPKVIHYCWFGNKTMPSAFQDNIRTWQKYCPDYEIVCWDETNYDVGKNLYMKQAYEKQMWGFVSDYARVDIVNQYGGIYLDTDVEMVKNFDKLLNLPLFCGFQNKWQVNFGLGFGAEKNTAILKELLDLYEQTLFINDDGSLNKKACPFYQTKILREHGLIENGKSQQTSEFLALSEEFFSPINPWGLGWITENTYSIHQYVGTWAGEEANNRDVLRKQFFVARMEQI